MGGDPITEQGGARLCEGGLSLDARTKSKGRC